MWQRGKTAHSIQLDNTQCHQELELKDVFAYMYIQVYSIFSV